MLDSWIFETPAPEPDARVSYGRGPFQFGELRLPTGPRDANGIPTVVVLHGGFWLAEFDWKHITHLCARLAEIGIATWCLEFRRLGNLGGGFPKTFRDVAAGTDFLRTLAEPHGLDLDRLAALGHSAGGQLALWLAGRAKLPADSPLHREDPLPVTKVFSLAGVADLARAHEQRLGDNVVDHLMGGGPDFRPERYDAACPSRQLPLGACQHIFHGDRDPFVPLELSRDYVAAARAAGDRAELRVLEGTGHFELVDPKTTAWSKIENAVLAHFDLTR